MQTHCIFGKFHFIGNSQLASPLPAKPTSQTFHPPEDMGIFCNILVKLEVKTPMTFLELLSDFKIDASNSGVPVEKINCKPLLATNPGAASYFNQLTFQGKMAATAVIKDVLIHLDRGLQCLKLCLNFIMSIQIALTFVSRAVSRQA